MAPMQRTMESGQRMRRHGSLRVARSTPTRCTAELGDEIWDAGSSDGSFSESEGDQIKGRRVAAPVHSTAAAAAAAA
eukprot:CAMPEP_0172834472 /NCGR_PEP_ID=MMETSP1075-20121228/25076_1 /TAXON_ID=2916 /ORGANISM="Ceratium fusus, Strain PA161109" /LENGTH=76 /DNA_ID=CAMNT_0013677373 /DNA_START=17 /DNA_END=243 /DNA_ORIENTATION=-